MRKGSSKDIHFQKGQAVLLIGALLLLTGCHRQMEVYTAEENKPDVRVNRIAMRRIAPQPTYNRLRWVHPPEVLPARDAHERLDPTRPKMLPVVHLEIEKTPLKEVALILGTATRYRTFCASLVENELVTMNKLGTLDELAESIEQQTPARVVIDHGTRSIRILGRNYISPRF